MRGHISTGFCRCYVKRIFFEYVSNLYNQNLLPIQQIHITHLQQYDENNCVHHARIVRTSQREKPAETGAISCVQMCDSYSDGCLYSLALSAVWANTSGVILTVTNSNMLDVLNGAINVDKLW